ncbi:MAG: pantoate--beta-alanine ligase [Erythrobacter sp.]|nr:pantoate--beta-alanine ligase [Erythrobacter sp.]
MQTVNTRNMLGKAIAGMRAGEAGVRIGFVPTMGALHEGHLTLVRRAREACDRVVASIFVNPAQFGPNEDLAAYPRQLEADAAMLEAEGCALLYAPGVAEMYPEGFATTVRVGVVSEGLDGAARPGHFEGVATVVAKLFNQVQPDMAFFGEKDFQQLAVIRRMARDLDLTRPHVDAIIAVPTVREADGLAMSSRNRYLSPQERAAAAELPRAMREAIAAIRAGAPAGSSLDSLEAALIEAGFGSVDYAVLADSASLEKLDALGESPARLLVAARIGTTRLIDNMSVE